MIYIYYINRVFIRKGNYKNPYQLMLWRFFWMLLPRNNSCFSYTSMMSRWKVRITEVDGDGWLGFFIRAGLCIWDGTSHHVMEIILLIYFCFVLSFEARNLIRDNCKDQQVGCSEGKWSAEAWQPWSDLTGGGTSYFGSVAWFAYQQMLIPSKGELHNGGHEVHGGHVFFGGWWTIDWMDQLIYSIMILWYYDVIIDFWG